jgi:RNA polymerase sigma-70 factor, ECF subfamily
VESAPSLTHRDDAALVTRIAAGESDALETVFRLYGGTIKSIAYRVLRNEALAEEAVQDVFVGLWESPQRYDPDRGTLRTFLVTIAHRRAINTVRSEQARFNREEKIPVDPPGSIDDEVWSRTASDEVLRAVASLSEREREAIGLAYFGHLTYVEVAQRLGLPEGTVKSRIRRGMRRLRPTLAAVAS